MSGRNGGLLRAVARAILAIAAAPLAAFAQDPGAEKDAPAPRTGLEARLVATSDRVTVHGSAPVRLTLIQHGPDVVQLDARALYGDGLVIRRGDRAFVVAAAPSSVKGKIALPAGAELSVPLDLGALLPAAFETPGTVEALYLDETVGAPLSIEVWRDFRTVLAEVRTSLGTMVFEFSPDRAPHHVRQFVELAEAGFYDGLIFHRVVKDFMIQGGCPLGNGRGDSGTFLPFEGSDLTFERGTVGMARGAALDSASCQFFVCHQRKRFLDGNYTAFAHLVSGYEVLDRIASVPCKWELGGPDTVPSRPIEPVTIQTVRIVERSPLPGSDRQSARDAAGGKEE